MNGLVTADNFLLESLEYFPVGNYLPVMTRPLTLNVTQNAIEQVVDKMCQSGNARLSSGMLGDVCSDILQPSAVGFESGVNDDWLSTRRFMFILKVTHHDISGTAMHTYIIGYTNHDGITPNGAADMGMVHHINNVIETTSCTFNTPTGVVHREKLYKVYNVFSGGGYDEIYTQRPTDILGTINMHAETNFLGADIHPVYTGNFLGGLANTTIGSTGNNNITTDYVCRMLNAGISGHQSRDLYIGEFSSGEDDRNVAFVAEPSLSDNRFIRALNRMAGYRHSSDSFTMSHLCSFDPTIYDRFDLVYPGAGYVNPLTAGTPDDDQTEFWTGQDPLTVKAYSLIENALAMMVRHGFSSLSFNVSNRIDPVGGLQVSIMNFKSFINLDKVEYFQLLELFKERLIQDVLINETQCGRVDIHADFHIDMLGSSEVELSYAGYAPVWYSLPNFCSSLFNPMMTIDSNALDNFAAQMGSMISTIASEIS